MIPFDRRAAATLLLAAAYSGPAGAVYLNPDGLGQALIYPYYTVRDDGGNSFNTYVSVVNTEGLGSKLLRVRFREAASGREVAGFNLFLGARDMWTAAVVPTTAGARLLTADSACTDPPMATAGPRVTALDFDASAGGSDASREGYIEIVEMATVPPGSDTDTAVTNVNTVPYDCAFVRVAANVTIDLRPPTGGLMGTLTLINVASGEDFTFTPDALDDLATQPFFRAAADPYPDFSAAEVRARSLLHAGGRIFDLRWATGVEAVSSVLMATQVLNEYVLDSVTQSRTDWVLTFPTRRFFPDPAPLFGSDQDGNLAFVWSDRDARTGENTLCSSLPVPYCQPQKYLLRATNVLTVANNESPMSLLGSANVISALGRVTDIFQSGWVALNVLDGPAGAAVLASQPGSTVYDPNSGAATTGTFRVKGLPVTGFMVRTFRNGTLSCGGQVCQGNYGGSFPHRYKRVIEPVVP